MNLLDLLLWLLGVRPQTDPDIGGDEPPPKP